MPEARREHQRALEETEKAKSEIRSLLMTHMALLERTPQAYEGPKPQQQTLIVSADPDTLPLDATPDPGTASSDDGQPERITVY